MGRMEESGIWKTDAVITRNDDRDDGTGVQKGLTVGEGKLSSGLQPSAACGVQGYLIGHRGVLVLAKRDETAYLPNQDSKSIENLKSNFLASLRPS